MGSVEAFRGQLKIQETAEEIRSRTIMGAFWNYMDELNLENGQSIKWHDVIDVVFERLNKEVSKENIEEQVREKLQSGKYIYRIVDNRNMPSVKNETIKLELSKSEERQRAYHKSKSDYANEKLATFVDKVEMYRKYLESKKIGVTEASLRQQFSEDEQEKNPRWISLAIDKVLKIQEQAR